MCLSLFGSFIYHISIDESSNNYFSKKDTKVKKVKTIEDSEAAALKRQNGGVLRWPNGEVPYKLSSKILHNEHVVDRILDGISHINTALDGCIKIR